MASLAIQDQGPFLRAFIISMIVLSTFSISLRFWSRALGSSRSEARIKSRFWWDDWLALLTMPFFIAQAALILCEIKFGLGRHIETVSIDDVLQLEKVVWASEWVYAIGTALPKGSALLFYDRVFATSSRPFKYALWTTEGLLVCWSVVNLFATVLFTCNPVQKAWLPLIDGNCQNFDTTSLGTAASLAVIDLIILVLPLPMLWRIQMKMSRKILITGVFMCGYCVIIVSIGRVISIYQAGPGIEDDPTWNTVVPIFWIVGEIPISVLSICLPSIFFLVRRGIREGPSSLFKLRARAPRANNPSLSLHGTEASLRHPEEVPLELGGTLPLESTSDSSHQEAGLNKYRSERSSLGQPTTRDRLEFPWRSENV